LSGRLAAVFGLGFSLLWWVLQRYVKRPLRQLQLTMIQMAKERNLALPLVNNSQDELGQMTRAVNDMVQGFRHSLQEVEGARTSSIRSRARSARCHPDRKLGPSAGGDDHPGGGRSERARGQLP